MRKVVVFVCGLAMVLGMWGMSAPNSHAGAKILHIDSYHEGYPWSDGIVEGVKTAIGDSGATLKVIHMDTKRNKSDEFKKQAALEAKAVIESFQPDVVIAADDNASKYLIVPYYKNKDLPFVFCGVNWDASDYGFPCENVTGMIEVSPVPQLLDQLKLMAQGDRVGYLAADVLTAKKEGANYRKVFGIDVKEVYAADFTQWKEGFRELQSSVDMLIVGNNAGINDWDEEAAKSFAEANTKVPTGAIYDFLAPYAFVVYGKVAQEQGFWAGQTALEILDGKAPASIAPAKNKEGKLIVNVRVAKNFGDEIPYELIEAASQIIE